MGATSRGGELLAALSPARLGAPASEDVLRCASPDTSELRRPVALAEALLFPTAAEPCRIAPLMLFAAAKRKQQHHQQAVARHGHVFIPFLMEANGHCDSSVTAFAQAVGAHLPRHELRVQDVHAAAAVC